MNSSLAAPALSINPWPSAAFAALLFAVVAPTLLAFSSPPSSTFYNQAAALVGWGCVLVTLGSVARWPWRPMRRELRLVLVPLVVVSLCVVWSMTRLGLPSSLGLSAIGMLAAAALVTIAAAAVRQSTAAATVFKMFCLSLVMAGTLGAILACVQIFLPDWTGGWLASVPGGGRASSNLRQPNHLSSLLIWALVALAWCWQTRCLPMSLCMVLGALYVFGIVLTGSRTGLVDFALLTIWAILDRRMPQALRCSLASTLLLYALFWWGMLGWAQETRQVFGGEAKLSLAGDISSSRYAIWNNALTLIGQYPGMGVGWGQFNFAWSLGPFPDRPVAFFDHTHNIALQFLVELGVPLATVVLLGLVAGISLVIVNGVRGKQPDVVMNCTSAMLLLTIGVHSLLEYPLWYAYFLLPASFVFGFGLVVQRGLGPAVAAEKSTRPSKWLAPLGAAMVVATLLAVADYRSVSSIFASDEPSPLAKRIAAGQRSVLFAYHADYAAATVADHPGALMPSFASASRNLLDTRLMIAWSKAYAERGDLDRARHIAQRLREFRNEDSREFFDGCSGGTAPTPFQCDPPSRRMNHEDFMR